jgi:hypothetical protein
MRLVASFLFPVGPRGLYSLFGAAAPSIESMVLEPGVREVDVDADGALLEPRL